MGIISFLPTIQTRVFVEILGGNVAMTGSGFAFMGDCP